LAVVSLALLSAYLCVHLRASLSCPSCAADKPGKSDFIGIMNGEFIQGRIKLNPLRCGQLADEYAGLIWDERSLKREEHPNCRTISRTRRSTRGGSVTVTCP